MTKTLIVIISLLFFLTRTCSGQLIQNSKLGDNENSLLWKISGNGLKHDSFLLGTMHNVGHTFLDSISGFRKAFKIAKQIAIEYDPCALDNQKTTLSQYVYLPQGTTYAALYNESDFLFVDSILRKGNSRYFKYKPMFWCSFFSNMILYQNIRGKEMGMDRFILLIGEQNYKKIYFMETLEEVNKRTAYLDSLRYSINLQYQAAALKTILQCPENISISINALSQLYKEQNISGLIALDSLDREGLNSPMLGTIQDEMKQNLKELHKHYFEVLGIVRNEKWMKNILPMIHENSSLIAVGAAHLIGVNGLIAKLRSRGYNVEPMK